MKNIQVYRKKDTIYLQINQDFTGELTVFINEFPNALEGSRKQGIKFNKGVSEGLGPAEKRVFYSLELAGIPYIGAERRVAVDGLYNFRDLGGYYTKDGKLTKWGLIYRSDAPDHLNEEDCSYLKKMQFSSAIDFRSPAEIALKPDVAFGEKEHYNFNPHAAIAKKASETPEQKSAKDQQKVEKLVKLSQTKEGQKQLLNMQQQMVIQMRELVLSENAQTAYRNFLTILLQRKVPNFFHCQGGKDRTGWAAAIILGLLGVDKTVIYEDYLLTEDFNRPRNEQRMSIYKQYTDNPFVLDYLASLQQTKTEYLDSAFHTMEENYGSMEKYAVEALKVTEKDLQRLKSYYLYE